MFSILMKQRKRPVSRPSNRRLRAESLETRRVLAAAVCFPALPAEAHLHDVPAQEGSFASSAVEAGKGASQQRAFPFRISGSGFASSGLPLVPGTTVDYSATGTASGLGRYDGAGSFTLGSLEISSSGAVSGTFRGEFVFTAANGNKFAVTYGDGFSGVFTGQLSADGSSVLDVEFDAIFTPDPANSTGRFASVVGGGWRMIAKTDSVSLVSDNPGFTAPFDFTWTGTGSLMFPNKAK